MIDLYNFFKFLKTVPNVNFIKIVNDREKIFKALFLSFKCVWKLFYNFFFRDI